MNLGVPVIDTSEKSIAAPSRSCVRIFIDRIGNGHVLRAAQHPSPRFVMNPFS